MKPGDLVKYRNNNDAGCSHEYPLGIVLQVDDSHRQTSVNVLFFEGISRKIWEGHLEVLDESR